MKGHRNTCIAFACAVFALSGCRQQKLQSAAGPPAVPVAVARVVQESIPFELHAVGTVEASSVVQVKSKVGGELLTAHFSEGQNVARGALLFKIDARPYREVLRQAEAALARDRAQLRQAEATVARDVAQAKNAEAEAARYTELSKAGVISQTQYDQVRTTADVYRESVRASQAAIESARAAIESEQAAIERAKLDIGYCEIQAPISGRTGNLLIHPGNLVKANDDTALVVIHQIAPIFVSFSVPDEHLGAIRRLSAQRQLPVRASLAEDSKHAAAGRLKLIDNTADRTTGTIRLKAEFDNGDGLLWPGQFVNVVLALDKTENATVIPAEAIQAGQQGEFVYVVKPDQKVEMRTVTVARTFGRKAIIEKGVAPGDTVVTDGQLRLYPDAAVRAIDAGKLESGRF